MKSTAISLPNLGLGNHGTISASDVTSGMGAHHQPNGAVKSIS